MTSMVLKICLLLISLVAKDEVQFSETNFDVGGSCEDFFFLLAGLIGYFRPEIENT